LSEKVNYQRFNPNQNKKRQCTYLKLMQSVFVSKTTFPCKTKTNLPCNKSQNILEHKIRIGLTLIEPVYDIFVLGFRPKKTAVFGCLTNALAPPPIAPESCSRAQTDRPV